MLSQRKTVKKEKEKKKMFSHLAVRRMVQCGQGG